MGLIHRWFGNPAKGRTRPLAEYQPFDLCTKTAPRDMVPREAKEVHKRLVERIPETNRLLEGWLREDQVDIETGTHAEILSRVGDWLVGKARTCRHRPSFEPPKTGKERLLVEYLIQQGDVQDIDTPTMSMCYYVGYYFSTLMIADIPECFYTVGTGKKNVVYNQTIVKRAGFLSELDPPTPIMNWVRRHILPESRPRSCSLGELFDIWVEMFTMSTPPPATAIQQMRGARE